MKHLRKFNESTSSNEENYKKFLDTKISLADFAYSVDMANSGYDRDCVFHYLESFLKENNINIDIEGAISYEAEL